MVEFEITHVHDEAAVSELRERLVAFNLAATGYDDYRSLSCFLRNDAGELEAGIAGFSWGGYAMIEWLWVMASTRRRGHGTGLVGAFEAEAQKRSCGTIRVNTHTFQAPDFYRHLGYEEIGHAQDTPLAYGEHSFANDCRDSLVQRPSPIGGSSFTARYAGGERVSPHFAESRRNRSPSVVIQAVRQ